MEYRQHAKQCRDLAARTPNPANKKKLKHEAETWAKMAALRERNLTDKDAATDVSLRINPAHQNDATAINQTFKRRVSKASAKAPA
jgi:hypothetical protein